MSSLRQDALYGLRAFSRTPGFAFTVVLILAVGIGAAIAVFTVFNALVFRPLPLPHPEQLVDLVGIYRNNSSIPLSYPSYAELERRQHAFAGICGWSGGADYNVEANGSVLVSPVHSVTANYYSVLGASPLLGRLISPADIQGTQISQVAVIGYEFWKQHFGGDPNIVNKDIRIDGKLFTIIGVTRQWFTGMIVGAPPEITIPVGAGQLNDLENRSLLWLFVTGRLQPGSNIQQVSSQIQSFWPRLLEDTVPTQAAGPRRQSWLAMRFRLDPASTGTNRELRTRLLKPLNLLLGIVALILLVVCVNLASLTLARASARRHDINTRIALGATPWQAVRQLVVESVSLASIGALVGLVLAWWSSHLLVTLLAKGADAPVLLDLRPDWRIVAFAGLTALFTGFFIGLIPAWQLSRRAPGTALRMDDQRTMGSGLGTLGKALIVSQIAISLILLQAAGLFIRTLESLRSFDPGFERASLLEVSLAPMPQGYTKIDMADYRRQLLDAMASLPSVHSVAFSALAIPAGENNGWKETVADTTDTNPSSNATTTLAAVSPGFFKTLAIPLLSGRDFTWSDDKQHPAIAVIDALTAKQLFPNTNPIGKHLRFGVQPDMQNLEIVGVAQNARILDVRDGNAPILYVPAIQVRDFGTGGHIVLRGATSTGITKTIDEEVRSFGHEFTTATATFEEKNERSFVYEQMSATLSTLFAAIALLVAGFGLFGLMSYAVTLRTREIGIRMAMGSQRAAILQLILREAVLLTLAGILIGVPCTLAATHLVARMIFGLSTADPLTLISASIILLIVGIIAGYIPAVRAMKLDPMIALRHD
ncbi:MAG: ABC transporter permease [Edaphobacter sp.]